MPTRPSPLFAITGFAVGAKAELAANTVYTATLDDLAGVSPVSWTVERTDDTTTPSTYTGGVDWVQSGAVGQTIQFRTAGAGTGGALKSTVAGGIDPVTGQVASSMMSAEVKFFVPTAEGLEVWITGETVDGDNVSSTTYGAIVPFNAVVRAAGGSVGAYKPPVKACTAAALPAYTRVGNVITANAVGAFSCDALMTWAIGDTFLLKDGAAGADNGVYALDVVGDGGTAWVATRVWWMDESAEVVPGCLIPVTAGATYINEVFQLTTGGLIIINTTPLTFSLWAGYWDRTGTVVHPEATGDAVVVGGTAVLGTEKLRVVGAVALGTGGAPTIGTLRHANGTVLEAALDFAGANAQILEFDAADSINVGEWTNVEKIALRAATGLYFEPGGSTKASMTGTLFTVSMPLIVDSAGSGSFATTGDIRLPDVCSCYAWGTGPQNVAIFTKDALDNLSFGNTAISPTTFLSAADNLQFYCGATQTAFINATAVDLKLPLTLLAAGYIRLGLVAGSGAGSASATGTIRLQHGASIKGRNQAESADWNLLSWGVSGNNQWYLGEAGVPGDGTIRVGGGYAIQFLSGASILDLRSAGSEWYCKMKLYNRTVAQITALGGVSGELVFATNEAGGATVVYYDGANWRRVYDNAIMS